MWYTVIYNDLSQPAKFFISFNFFNHMLRCSSIQVWTAPNVAYYEVEHTNHTERSIDDCRNPPGRSLNGVLSKSCRSKIMRVQHSFVVNTTKLPLDGSADPKQLGTTTSELSVWRQEDTPTAMWASGNICPR